jgi:hypothetical protein
VANLSQIADRLEKQFGLHNAKAIHVDRLERMTRVKKIRRPEHYESFYQAWLNDRKIFIRYGGYEGISRREFNCAHRLNSIDGNNFVEVLFYSESENCRCVATEFLEGQTLLDFIENPDTLPAERKSFIIQLKNIAKCLAESGVVHGDTHAGNFIVTKDGKLKLFDFGWSFESGQPGVCSTFRRDSWWFRRVCVNCNEWWRCCDVFMLQRTLKAIGCQESYEETYREVETFLQEYPKTIVVRCKYRVFYTALLKLKKIFLYCFYYPLRDEMRRYDK